MCHISLCLDRGVFMCARCLTNHSIGNVIALLLKIKVCNIFKYKTHIYAAIFETLYHRPPELRSNIKESLDLDYKDICET